MNSISRRLRALFHIAVGIGRRNHDDVRAAMAVLIELMTASDEDAIGVMKGLRFLCDSLDEADREWMDAHYREDRAISPLETWRPS